MNLNHKNTPFFQAYPQIPLFPIYGYDNSEEAERDFDYMKQLYPRSSLKIQELIEEACDKLEYEGSIMFDEYPDRLQLALMANKIYNQIAPSALPVSPKPASRPDGYGSFYGNSDDAPALTRGMAEEKEGYDDFGYEEDTLSDSETAIEPEEELISTSSRRPGGFPGNPGRPVPPPPPGRPGRPMPPPPPGRPVPPPPGRPGRPVPPPPGYPGRPGEPAPPWRPTPPSDSDNPNWLRNLIEVMLCNEMCQRRRRYRSRKRWM